MKNWLKIDKATIFTGKDENGNRYLSQFLKDYSEAFNIKDLNAACEKCLDNYYEKLTKYLSKMSDKKPQNSGYRLKEKYNGISLGFGSRTIVSNRNLTDKLAEKLLKDHPRGEKLFDKIPEKKKASTSTDGPEKTRLEVLKDMKRNDELNPLAEELGLNPGDYANKDEIAAAIEEAEKKKASENEGEE